MTKVVEPSTEHFVEVLDDFSHRYARFEWILITQMQATGAKLVFATATPVPKGSFCVHAISPDGYRINSNHRILTQQTRNLLLAQNPTQLQTLTCAQPRRSTGTRVGVSTCALYNRDRCDQVDVLGETMDSKRDVEPTEIIDLIAETS